MLTAELLSAVVGCTPATARTWIQPLSHACRVYEIDSRPRLAAFLAQVGHESAGLTRTVENLNYSAEGLRATWPRRFDVDTSIRLARKPVEIAEHVYAGRLGNKLPGDGWRYRGRGLIQVTGRANYDAVTDLMRAKVATAPDLVHDPDALAEPRWAALSAAAYWADHDLNELADMGQFTRITQRINGGHIGAADRNARYARAKRVLG